MSKTAQGLAFGLNNSSLYVTDEDEVPIFRRFKIPNFTAFEPHHFLAEKLGGPTVFQDLSNDLFHTLFLLATNHEDASVQKHLKSLPFHLVQDASGEKVVKVVIQGKQLTPEKVLIKILKSLNRQGSQSVSYIPRTVLTFPVSFTPAQEDLLEDLSNQAGFHVLGRLDEHTAAACGHLIPEADKHKILVFDLSQKTFHVSLLENLNPENLPGIKRTTKGREDFGGETFLQGLTELAIDELKNKRRYDLRKVPANLTLQKGQEEDLVELKRSCQSAFLELSEEDQVEICLKDKHRIVVDRSGFERANLPNYQICASILTEVLQEAGAKKEEIRHVVLLGKSAQMPSIPRLIKQLFGTETEIHYGVQSDSAAMFGATLGLTGKLTPTTLAQGTNLLMSGIGSILLGTTVPDAAGQGHAFKTQGIPLIMATLNKLSLKTEASENTPVPKPRRKQQDIIEENEDEPKSPYSTEEMSEVPLAGDKGKGTEKGDSEPEDDQDNSGTDEDSEDTADSSGEDEMDGTNLRKHERDSGTVSNLIDFESQNASALASLKKFSADERFGSMSSQGRTGGPELTKADMNVMVASTQSDDSDDKDVPLSVEPPIIAKKKPALEVSPAVDYEAQFDMLVANSDTPYSTENRKQSPTVTAAEFEALLAEEKSRQEVLMEVVDAIYKENMDKVMATPTYIEPALLQENHEVSLQLSLRTLSKLTPLTQKLLDSVKTTLDASYTEYKEINLQKKQNKGPAIGIDVGTTFCCTAIYRDGKVEIVPNSMGKSTTPSYVAFPQDGSEILVGEQAKIQACEEQQNAIFDVKRLLGRSPDDEHIQPLKKYWPFKLFQENRKVQIQVGQKLFFPEEIMTHLIRYIKQCAEEHFEGHVTNAVVTVPAYFNDRQRTLTKESCKRAGLNVLQLVNEPTAAAVAYSLHKKDHDTPRHCLIFDFGGGTFDIAILYIRGQNIHIKAIDGDAYLGGEDFDNKMVQHCIRECKRMHNVDLTKVEGSQEGDVDLIVARRLRRLKRQCEKQKCLLSNATCKKVVVTLDSITPNVDLEVPFSRDVFEALIEEQIQRCMSIIDRSLGRIDLSRDDIKEVVLVGGSSRIPRVHQVLMERFPNSSLAKSINADEAVASGAAILAACAENPELPNISIQECDNTVWV